MRTLPLILGIGLTATARAGEPVLLPDLQAASPVEVELARPLWERLSAALADDGHIVVDAIAVRPVVGDTLTHCWDAPGCPYAALQQLPGRVAVVGRLVMEGGLLSVDVAVYEENDSSPVETRRIAVPPGGEDAFAQDVAAMTTDIVSLLTEPERQSLIEAMKLVEAAHAPPPVPVAEPEPLPVPAPAPAPAPVHVELTLDEILSGTGVKRRHLAGSQQVFLDSELDPRDWVYKATPHAGRVVIEVRGGIGIGDVDRRADIRVKLEEGENVAEWWQEGPVPHQRVRGGLFLGYAPVTFFDFGVLVGLQYGQKYLTTGWYRDDSAGQTSPESIVQAVQVLVQPRLRFYLAPTGPAKPYVVAAPEIRYFDAYHIIDPASVDYPDPWGGVVPGATGAFGLMIDPSPIAGFFVEGSYTQHFGIRSIAAQNGNAPEDRRPEAPRGRQHTIGVVGGVQFRI